MEFPSIGRQCSITDCNSINFLPVRCCCEQYFCENHFFNHAIICTEMNKNFRVDSEKLNNLSGIENCSKSECKRTSLLHLECKLCKNKFCIEHRYHTPCFQDLTGEFNLNKNSSNDQFNKVHELIDKGINEKLSAAMKKSSHISKTANKINLMRLKNRAKGDSSIPITDRLYFTVHLKNRKGIISNAPIFFSQTWTVGRAIDSIAKLCDLINRNNEHNVPQLRLFRKSNCQLLKMSSQLLTLINDNLLANGDEIVIDYCEYQSDVPLNSDLF